MTKKDVFENLLDEYIRFKLDLGDRLFEGAESREFINVVNSENNSWLEQYKNAPLDSSEVL